MAEDRHNIIPRSILPGGGAVRPLEFQVRILMEYDASRCTDQLRASIFANGSPCGVFATLPIPEEPSNELERRSLIAQYGPDLERAVVDEFIGFGYRQRVLLLENELRGLKVYIDRPRWWQVRRLWIKWLEA